MITRIFENFELDLMTSWWRHHDCYRLRVLTKNSISLCMLTEHELMYKTMQNIPRGWLFTNQRQRNLDLLKKTPLKEVKAYSPTAV